MTIYKHKFFYIFILSMLINVYFVLIFVYDTCRSSYMAQKKVEELYGQNWHQDISLKSSSKKEKRYFYFEKKKSNILGDHFMVVIENDKATVIPGY